LLLLGAAATLIVTTSQTATPVEIQKDLISNHAEFWWARAATDLNGDGLLDLVLQNNNAHGGWLGWLEGRLDGLPWNMHHIAAEAPNAQPFASGDLDAGDIDNDGDPDVLGFAHPGEWDEPSAPTQLYWYENPSWKPHPLGTFPSFVKDTNLADLNGDGRLDLVGICFEGNSLRVFRQDEPHQWTLALDLVVPNLHEGMDVGDLDGDGDLDIATNGYWLENPGADMSQAWPLRSIDSHRHDQTGDWSRNASKVACADVNHDGRAEVFISHSERPGYPVACYSTENPATGPWTKHVLLPNLAAAHTLQILDANLDGYLDVLTGINRGRGESLGLREWPVQLCLGMTSTSAPEWEPLLLATTGIYNGQVADVDADGDSDLFRLSSHDSTTLELWCNPTRKPGQRIRFDFSDATPGTLPPGWKQGFTGDGRSDWQILEVAGNRVLAQTAADNPNAHFQLAWFDQQPARNLSLTVNLRAVAGRHDQGGGLVWRARDHRSYYVVRANPLENNVVLYKMLDGKRASLPIVGRDSGYGVAVPALGHRWHRLAVDVQDNIFSVSLNGQNLFSVQDDSLPEAGFFGLWTKADAVTWFDQLQVVLRP